MFFLISPCSWYLRRGVTAPSAPKVDVKRAAMAAASGNLLVSDYSKYRTVRLHKLATPESFALVVTDN
ncbi:hypothetical protein [Paraburkholderia sp. CI3]|uniref:hypothetical protein n=1 Tax=Paraburkholderia sp. CI3 TaxID=2991060 RepID=UPI003D1F2491